MAHIQSSLPKEAPLCSLGCCLGFSSLVSATSRYSELSVAFCEFSVGFLVNSGRGHSMWQTPRDDNALLLTPGASWFQSYRRLTSSKDGM